ncbi:hypothetical protein [Enterovibrio nigricans]|uniref:Uncharacterized protein n=1 Tax=Enterovibrio nigricans DSM 22720 TaxID=1121868 RepID=A0A1T4UWV1_9GAMM|nr:hypothetical protein [Enterovibrio nigricans]PKF50842.1 hypothetical protein AT251_08285 [Enterovibrio nigricans]SKA57115.1 hypothetical protein SAMN02745132_02696 [Enterovibrio nigricans DSM 22720]
MDAFQRINALESGYHDVTYNGERWGLSIGRYSHGHALKIFAEAVSGNDVVSGNLYLVDDIWSLKPCEMAREKVMSFLLGFELIK